MVYQVSASTHRWNPCQRRRGSATTRAPEKQRALAASRGRAVCFGIDTKKRKHALGPYVARSPFFVFLWESHMLRGAFLPKKKLFFVLKVKVE
jgi:hypothetical protein